MELLFSVKQTHLADLESEVMAVSDPSSERYGHHLTNEEVHSLVAPKPEYIATVHEFLKVPFF